MSRGRLLVAIRMSQTIGRGAPDQAFDLGIGRRDFGDALDDRNRSVAALHFESAATKFVERLKRTTATHPADAGALLSPRPAKRES